MNVYITAGDEHSSARLLLAKVPLLSPPGQEKAVRDPDGTRRKEVLIGDIAEFQAHWTSAVDALESAISILRHPQEYGAVSSSFLPYVSILPVFASLRAHAKTHRNVGAKERHSEGRAGSAPALPDGDNHRCLHAGDSRERASNGQLNQRGIEEIER
jgi:hypothetical protein